MSGWIKLHRSLQDHWIYEDKPFNKSMAWIDLLISASHKDIEFLFGNQTVKLTKGSFITSEQKLMKKWGWSKTKVRNFLEFLKKNQMISVKSERNIKTTITIDNYSIYQDQETNEKPPKNHKKTNEEPPKDPIKNDKNDKKNNKPDLEPNQDGVDYDKFRDYFNAKAANKMPLIKILTKARKDLIKNRIREHGKKTVVDVIDRALKSDFLTNISDNNWGKANFDWIMKQSNFVKIIEGNYDNKEKKPKQSVIYEIRSSRDEINELLRESEELEKQTLNIEQ